MFDRQRGEAARLLRVRNAGRVALVTPTSDHALSVSMPLFLEQEIAASCAGKLVDALVLGDGTTRLTQSTLKGGWLCRKRRPRGEPTRSDPTFPQQTVYGLRHATASLAVGASANVKAVEQVLGRASVAMTLNAHADLFDENPDAVAAALKRARAAEVVRFLWPIR